MKPKTNHPMGFQKREDSSPCELTSCLLFFFHVSAFLFEFMFWNANYNKKQQETIVTNRAISHQNPISHMYEWNTLIGQSKTPHGTHPRPSSLLDSAELNQQSTLVQK